MKANQTRKIGLVLMLIAMVSIIFISQPVEASAATPTFAKKEVEIIGDGETYQLEIKNKVAGSTYKWTTSKPKVAKVNSRGLVTTVGKGNTTIKCKITYPNGKSKTISTKVIVKIPATGIKINNAKEVNGAHILQIGEKYNFNRDIFPSNSSDKTYWSIGGGDAECIKIENTSNGILTGKKVGKVILVATAAEKSDPKYAKESIVNDAIIIEVVGQTARVKSVDIVGSTEIKVVFDSTIDVNTLLDSKGKLLNNIELLRRETKGVLASDPGALQGSLSSDGKTLTITASNKLDGSYGFNLSSKIKTQDGIALEEHYKVISYVDDVPPSITGFELDDTGMIATIHFNEAVDLRSFRVSDAKLLLSQGTTTADPSTLTILKNKLNYVQSEDKKSISINLSKIASADYNKSFLVTFAGIEDLSGNIPDSYTLTTIIKTDTTPKAQARIINVRRTSYDSITTTFDRGISYPGWAMVGQGSFLDGEIDKDNNKIVHYRLNDTDAKLTGVQTVFIGHWDSFNVRNEDTSANKMHEYKISFAYDRSNPFLIDYVFDPDTNILTLTYNKEVKLNNKSGVFNSKLYTSTDEIRPGTLLEYTEVESQDQKQVKLLIKNITLVGNYLFELEQGMVVDNYRNVSLARELMIGNESSTSMELPGPYAIVQSKENSNQIYLEFANMLDVASASNPNNYSIAGVDVIAASVAKNTRNNGSTVILTVAEGSIDVSLERPITISKVKGYDGTYSEIVEFKSMVELRDNTKPIMIGQPTFLDNQRDTIRLTFNEEIKGSMVVETSEFSNNYNKYSNVVTVDGYNVYIKLDRIPAQNTAVRVEIKDNKITDISENPSQAVPSTLIAVAR